MNNRKGFRTFTALLLAVVMILGNALAGTYYIEDGSIEVHATETSQTVKQTGDPQDDDGPVITNRDPETSSANTVTIKADDGCTANVKVENLNIDVSTKYNTPAVKTEGAGAVNIELDGNSSIKSGKFAAGLQKENTGNLTINDADQNGKLEATGGEAAAGIGGGNNGIGKDITISGGEVTAAGGYAGAGIGGGDGSEGKDITISGGEVTATGGKWAAGIGGGHDGKGKDITISGGEVTANGGHAGAGIGGGFRAKGEDITINGGDVTATGGEYGAGIGGGNNGEGKDITISGGEIAAQGGQYGAGIGGGEGGEGKDITISGGEIAAQGGQYGAGIGGGNAKAENIKISGGRVIASGGETGAGIGGGRAKEGKNITISGSALINAVGGTGEDKYQAGAGIGNGGTVSGVGSEASLQESDLGCGCIKCFAPGTKAEDIRDGTAQPTTIVDNPDIGHDYTTDWTYNETQHWHTCKNSGCKAKTQVSKHTWEDYGGSEATCTKNAVTPGKKCKCGKILKEPEEVPESATGHNWDTVWSKNDTKHWHKCTNAGCTAVKDEEEHNFDTFVERTKEPTCTETGTDVYQCTCGATTEKTVKANGHTWETEWSKNDTKHWHKCTNAGCTAVQDEAEHNYATFVERTKDPTCTETGTDVYKCTCGATTEVIVEAGHSPAAAVKENEVPAEVGVAGSYDEVVYCSACGEEISRKTVTIDPLPEPAQKKGEDFSALLARKIRQAPENGTVEADAGTVSGLKKIVFEALEERPDVTVKLKTGAGDIIIPAGANLMEKTGGKPSVSFEELKGILE